MLTNIAVLVSGGGTNLQALIDKQGSVIKSGKITLVISNKEDAFALERAKNNGIDSFFVQKKGKTQEEFESQVKALLTEYNIDIIVLAGFTCIISADFVKSYPNRIINVHPSLIPKHSGKGFYGLKVHESVLNSGDKITGATVHYVNEITDGGEIIDSKCVEVLDGDTPEILQKRVMEEAEWILLPQATEMLSHLVMLEKNK